MSLRGGGSGAGGGSTAGNGPVGVISYGLAIGKGGCTVPVGVRAHAIGDNSIVVPTTGAGSQVFRSFQTLSDPGVLDVLPVFNNPLALVGFGNGDTADAPNSITISAAVEHWDGAATIVPFTFNGSHTATIGANYGQLLIPDAPLSIGTQVSAVDKFSTTIALTGFWLRVWVQTLASRTDTGVTITSTSPTVLDSSIASADQGCVVTGTGIPGSAGTSGCTYVGTVTAGTSFLLSSSPQTQTNVNATSSAGTTVTINRIIPCNMGPYANLDNFTANGASDLTLPGSGNVSGGSGSYTYGPAIILGRSKVRKPIVAAISDSILDGYSEDFHSAYFGSVARACTNLGYPLVKLSKGGESAAAWAGVAVGGRKYRSVFLDGCTHAIISLGTNDGELTTGNGAGGVTTLLARLVAIGTLCNTLGIKPYVCTVPPRTTTNDGWATTTGQTPIAGSQITYLASLNSQLRAGVSPFAGVYDLCGLVNSTQDSGLFAVGASSRVVTDGTTTSTGTNVVTSATANFTNADVNTGIYVTGGVTSTNAVIGSLNSSTSVNVINGVGGSALNNTGIVSGVRSGIGAYATTIDGVHPVSSISTGALTTAIQALFATFTV